MSYAALTVDTNILIEQGLTLDGEVLADLKQFRDSPTDVIISQIVIEEMRNKIVDNLKSRCEKLKQNAEDAGKAGLLSEVQQKQIAAILEEVESADVVAEKRIKKFIEEHKIEVVDISSVDLSEIVEDYFEGKEPFEKRSNKKHEFPDAIALNSLEKWANRTNKRLLCVSKDNGWHSYCAGNTHLDCVDNLPDALDKMQENSEEIRKNISEFLNEEIADIEERFIGFLKNEYFLAEVRFDYVEISGAGRMIDVNLQDLEIDISEVNIRILENNIDAITVQVNLSVEFEMDVETEAYTLMQAESDMPADEIPDEIHVSAQRTIPVKITIAKGKKKMSEPTFELKSISSSTMYSISFDEDELHYEYL